MEKQQYYNVIFRRAEKGRHDIHAELNGSRALTDQVSREKVLEKEKEEWQNVFHASYKCSFGTLCAVNAPR